MRTFCWPKLQTNVQLWNSQGSAKPQPFPRRPTVCSASSQEAEQTTPSPSICKTCGVPLRDVPRGCNQEGRVAGGIGAVVGFDWWPIKAYKPCPKAAKAGVSYSRKGQITDEMLFGRRKNQQ